MYIARSGVMAQLVKSLLNTHKVWRVSVFSRTLSEICNCYCPTRDGPGGNGSSEDKRRKKRISLDTRGPSAEGKAVERVHQHTALRRDCVLCWKGNSSAGSQAVFQCHRVLE